MATKAFGYSSDFLDLLYKIYLNHNKVIHFRDGYPVYSLATPALYTKPQANFFARQLYKLIRGKNAPNLMSFAVNDRCNADCEHCSFTAGLKKRNELTLDQCRKVLRDAQELGVSVINFVGGEPLLREDLPEIIRSVDKDLSTTVLFTNGLLLAERALELRRSGLDSVYVSIDSAEPDKHDHFRGKKGIFEEAMKGITKAKSVGMSVGISCCMTPEAFREGGFENMARLGKKIGVHEILVFGAIPTGKYKDRKDLIGDTDWIEEMIDSAKTYNNDESYPGILIYPYASSHRCIGCSGGVCYFYVSPYGDVCPCDFNHTIFGNLFEEPLYRIWDKMTSLKDFECVKWGGCKLKDPEWRDRDTVSGEFRSYFMLDSHRSGGI